MDDDTLYRSLHSLFEGAGGRYPIVDGIPRSLQRLLAEGPRGLNTAKQIARLIGDAAGHGEDWRGVFREAGILSYVLEQLNSAISVDLELAKQYLRIIGNCLGGIGSEEDRNRDVVMPAMEVLITCLEQKALATTAVGVLTNLCNDYEPAQDRAAEVRLDSALANYLANRPVPDGEDEESNFDNDEVNSEEDEDDDEDSENDDDEDEADDEVRDIITLLVDITAKLKPEQLQDTTSLSTFRTILSNAMDCSNRKHRLDYGVILTRFLQDQTLQRGVAKSGMLKNLLQFTLSEDHMYPAGCSDEAWEDEGAYEELWDEEGAYEGPLEEEGQHERPSGQINKIMRLLSIRQDQEFTDAEPEVQVIVNLINSLGAISATDEFVRRYTIYSPEIEELKLELFSDNGPAIVLACVMLGNLATSDEASIRMMDMGLDTRLFEILSSSKEPALLYAAAGFVRHLAFPRENRAELVREGLFPICCRLLKQSDPSVRGEAAAIIGKLTPNNHPLIKEIICERAPGRLVYPNYKQTVLDYLVGQALAPSSPVPSTSMKNAMVELGRVIVTIMRHVFQSARAQGLALRVFKTPLVARPVARLVRQRFFTDARSEGLLGLGLMAQTREGAECVVEEIKADKGLLEAVKEFVDTQNGGKGGSGTNLGRDHENALVLLHALAKNGVGAMDASLKSDIDALQAELSNLSLSGPSKQHGSGELKQTSIRDFFK